MLNKKMNESLKTNRDGSGSTPNRGESQKPASGGGSVESGLSMRQEFSPNAIDETEFGQPKPEKRLT
jgi:hypothetical protein